MYNICKLSHPINKKTVFKIIRKIIMIFLIFLFFLSLYQFFSIKKDMKKINILGKRVTVLSNHMQVYDDGKSKTSIVLISNNNVPSACSEFSELKIKLLEFGRVFTYDKCGCGLSEKSVKKLGKQDLAIQLKTMLKKREIKAPYILVAHSAGSLEALAFAQSYPKEVAGLVLLNGENPEVIVNNYKPSKIAYLYQFMRNTGILRLGCNLGVIPSYNQRRKYIENDLLPLDKALFLKNYYNSSAIDKNNSLKDLSKKIIAEGTLKNIPTLVISSSLENSNVNYSKSVWINSQKDLLSWSSNSKQLNLDNLGYNIHQEDPATVATAIKEFSVEALKKTGK